MPGPAIATGPPLLHRSFFQGVSMYFVGLAACGPKNSTKLASAASRRSRFDIAAKLRAESPPTNPNTTPLLASSGESS
jgi:hypothetical protein